MLRKSLDVIAFQSTNTARYILVGSKAVRRKYHKAVLDYGMLRLQNGDVALMTSVTGQHWVFSTSWSLITLLIYI
jgi:hypothetical protein